MLASIYIRVSSEDQAAADRFSLAEQRRACLAVAAAKGDDVVEIYTDSGATAFNDDLSCRPEFARMLQDARAGRFRRVYCYSLDRFSRASMSASGEWLRVLEQAGVELVSVLEWYDSSPSGELLRTILLGQAHFFSRLHGQKVSGGLREKQRRGLHTGRRPYGYTAGPTKNMVVNESQAGGYHLAVKLLLGGEDNLSQLARMLNAAGYRTGRGLPWHHRALLVMLHNPAYLGVVTLPDGTQLPGSHPPLIERPEWELVQSRLREWHKPRRGRRTKTAYPLSGILRCNRCDERMQGSELPGKGRVYACARRKKEGRAACPGIYYFYADACEELVARMLDEIHLADNWREAVEAELAGAQAPRGPSPTEIRRQERALMDMYQLGTFAGDKAEFKRRWDELQAQRQTAAVPARPAVLQVGALLEQGLGQLWRASTDQAARRKLALLLFQAVYVDGPRMNQPEIKRLEWRPEVEVLLHLE